MMSKVAYEVNRKENIYFYLRLIASVILYYLLVRLIMLSFDAEEKVMLSLLPLYFYVILFIIYLFFRFGVLIGFLKGNAVRIGKNQFPDIYKTVERQSEMLGIGYLPAVYILQSGGILNAYATSFLGRNYIVLYSDVVAASNEQDKNMLEFIIAHELGHLKRKHMIKKLLLWPSWIIPFLGSAYSRACEYTCDNIGHALCPAGTSGGLLLLASGKNLYKKVNLNEFIGQRDSDDRFWSWLAEKVSSHPHLIKRLAVFNQVIEKPVSFEPPLVVEHKEEDHSKYMPR